MKDQPVKWFPDAAARFIELLKAHSWNEAVRLLKAEKHIKFDSLSEVEGKRMTLLATVYDKRYIER